MLIFTEYLKEQVDKSGIKDIASELGINPKILENDDALYTIKKIFEDARDKEIGVISKFYKIDDEKAGSKEVYDRGGSTIHFISQEIYDNAYRKALDNLRNSIDENGNIMNIISPHAVTGVEFRDVKYSLFVDTNGLIHVNDDYIHKVYHESGIQMSYSVENEFLIERNPNYVTATATQLAEDGSVLDKFMIFANRMDTFNKDCGGLLSEDIVLFSEFNESKIKTPQNVTELARSKRTIKV